jgi:hypothetical protein
MLLYVDTTYIHMSHEAPFLMLIVGYMCFTHSCLSAVSFSIYVCDSPTYASKPAAPSTEYPLLKSTTNLLSINIH